MFVSAVGALLLVARLVLGPVARRALPIVAGVAVLLVNRLVLGLVLRVVLVRTVDSRVRRRRTFAEKEAVGRGRQRGQNKNDGR